MLRIILSLLTMLALFALVSMKVHAQGVMDMQLANIQQTQTPHSNLDQGK